MVNLLKVKICGYALQVSIAGENTITNETNVLLIDTTKKYKIRELLLLYYFSVLNNE